MPLLSDQAGRSLLENRRHANGEDGAAWVERLPQLVAAAAERWSLTLEPHFPDLGYNYVAPASLPSGERAVLKLSYTGDEEGRGEIEAAVYFSGSGGARVLAVDRELGALLMERLEPGLQVCSLGDDAAEVSATAAVMRRLWRPPPEGDVFPAIGDWIENAAGLSDGRPSRIDWLDRGVAMGRQLVARPEGPPVLLHGDLHHYNVLSSGDGWLCIDPKGVAGEAAWEVGPYLYNELPDEAGEAAWRRQVRRRADQFAEELGLDRTRVYACAAVYAVLSSSWSLDEPRRPVWFAKRRAVMTELAGFQVF